jgi:outer membrane protein assembly factor BamB/predicted phosphodiesterase
MKLLLCVCLLILASGLSAQTAPFRFAFLSDTHIGSPNGAAEEDLRRTVADINTFKDLDFVVLTGDITELGTDKELALAKKILDSLNIPYYIIPGNHDTGWSESGGLGFTSVFGSDRFFFRHKGISFIGCASGPYVRMSDGHVPRDAVNWMKKQLATLPPGEPVIFLNHYPLDNGLDNWYEIVDALKERNTILALCGHGHTNRPVNAEGLPAVMGRSNLRAKENEGGYNLVDVRMDSILFTERKPISGTNRKWTGVANVRHQYDKSNYPRPDYSMNQKYKVKAVWTYSSAANIISTPTQMGNLVITANQMGTIEALSLKEGKRKWSFQTGGPVYSTPAVSGNRVVVGSTDHFIYCLNEKGKQLWKTACAASVLGCALIKDNRVYIGASDHRFRMLDLQTGKILWEFSGLEGPVVSTPVIADSLVVFGAWDKNLYALHQSTGQLAWKWNNGSSVINYAPAACIPVVNEDVVYIVAPDRFLTALDLHSGTVLWRINAGVRESIGRSEDGRLVYGKTMQDTVVAFYTNRESPRLAWKLSAGFGYEHAPSMLIEKDSRLFFGTRNGVVYALDPKSPTVTWAYKLDNSMVNTVRPINGHSLLATTMDGKVCLLEAAD